MTADDGSKKPSNKTRFKKGQSGNPKGRPKDGAPAPTGSAFEVVFDRTLTIRKDGIAQDVSVEEALQHQTYEIANEKPASGGISKYRILAAPASRRSSSKEVETHGA
ncbi:hypothetical protein C1J05_17235 [Sulfitobacter sp. JL08]|uniref:DUF5681 domain-containing protein n=1 Tax=Sulfitobacter sp. JL08 TaxID=2070369 RepID=UPI000E0C6AC6|nr:DUF5681 domain-containing protein [Sulfitobacter sp. JL08]AXI56007.1 hypothetical protein C1J05_17235 [Sulfitobacter sp. JL08]